MSRGGARIRSGPAPDPNSGRSDKRGLSFKALPNEGYRGEIPDFPKPVRDPRVLELWEEAWRTPQAAAWALESWRWNQIANYCDVQFLIEADPSASMIAQLHRLEDRIGMSDPGMIEKGWQIAHSAFPQADNEDAEEAPSQGDSSSSKRARDRMKVVVSE